MVKSAWSVRHDQYKRTNRTSSLGGPSSDKLRAGSRRRSSPQASDKISARVTSFNQCPCRSLQSIAYDLKTLRSVRACDAALRGLESRPQRNVLPCSSRTRTWIAVWRDAHRSRCANWSSRRLNGSAARQAFDIDIVYLRGAHPRVARPSV